MYVIGLVGTAASGKSTVLRHLKELGAKVIDADQVARELRAPGKPLYEAIIGAFGSGFLLPGGEIDRKRLRETVFSKASLLERLNEISREILVRELKKRLHAVDANQVVALEAVRLYEAGLDGLCDEVWQVVCDKDVQVARLAERDGITKGEAERMLERQQPLLSGRCDVRVDNSGEIRYTLRNVEQHYQKIREKWCDGK